MFSLFKRKIIVKLGLFFVIMMSYVGLLKGQIFATNLNNENDLNFNIFNYFNENFTKWFNFRHRNRIEFY